MDNGNDLMGRGEWDNFWRHVDPHDYIPSLTFHDRILLVLLHKLIEDAQPKRCLEIGCANSKNLYRLPSLCHCQIYFFGLDPSTEPLSASYTLYDKNRVFFSAGDLFASPLSAGKFGMISSFGLIEHYRDPQPFLISCLELLEPGGTLIAGYPSYQGLTGWIQRKVNPGSLKHHFSLPALAMATEFKSAGLIEVKAEYFGLFNPNMIDWGKGNLRRALMYFCFAAIRPVEWLSSLIGIKDLPGMFSSYVVTVGRKPS